MKVNQATFPYHSGKKDNRTIEYVKENVKVVLDILSLPNEGHRSKAIRSLLGGISNYFERNEGYTYGLSQGFIDNIHLATGKGYNPNGKVFELEHSIPLKVIENHLRSSNMNIDEAITYLQKAMHLYLITKDENSALKSYKSSMPIGAQPDDVLARYNAVGIKIVKNWHK